MTAESIRSGLRNFARVYEYMKPFEKRELIRIVLSGAQIGDRTLILDVYETACAGFAQAVKSDSRSEPPIWLPGLPAQSVLVDTSLIALRSLSTLHKRSRNHRRAGTEPRLWAARLGLPNQPASTIAKQLGVTRAAVSLSLSREAGPRTPGPTGYDVPAANCGRS